MTDQVLNSDLSETPLAVRLLIETLPVEMRERLHEDAERMVKARAPNSIRSWGADVRVWRAFCKANELAPFPVTLQSLEMFLEERIKSGRKLATLAHYVASLRTIHRLAEVPFPLDSKRGQLMWEGVSKKVVSAQRQAKGLTLDDVGAIRAKLDPERPEDLRDSALIAVAFETMFRRSEIASLDVEDFTFDIDADGDGKVFLARSKTDKKAKGVFRFLSAGTMAALKAWMSAAGVNSGAMFRSASCVPGRAEKWVNPLQGQEIARIFKRRARRAGLDYERVSGHSARVGATQDLVANGFSNAEIMEQGRWKTERMVQRYTEELELKRSAMARLLRAKNL